MRFLTDAWAPLPSAIIAMTAATPITMPNVVSTDRMTFAASAAAAIFKKFKSHSSYGFFFVFAAFSFAAFASSAVHFVDPGFAGHLDVVRVHELAVLALQLDPVDRALGHALPRRRGGGRLGDLAVLDQRIRDVPLVLALRLRRGHGDDDRRERGDEWCGLHE